MTARRYYTDDYTDDLLTMLERGMTVTDAAAELGMSRRTATRLLAAHRAAQGPAPRRVLTPTRDGWGGRA